MPPEHPGPRTLQSRWVPLGADKAIESAGFSSLYGGTTTAFPA